MTRGVALPSSELKHGRGRLKGRKERGERVKEREMMEISAMAIEG